VEYALAVLLLAALVAFAVTRPLRSPGAEERREQTRIAELRDAELDHRMGKLSKEDWRAVDRDLRAEAIVILSELDRLEGETPNGGSIER
jgi:flagellar biosynthesis/type III secretory pathway M-ring protein FliF/YscJ